MEEEAASASSGGARAGPWRARAPAKATPAARSKSCAASGRAVGPASLPVCFSGTSEPRAPRSPRSSHASH